MKKIIIFTLLMIITLECFASSETSTVLPFRIRKSMSSK